MYYLVKDNYSNPNVANISIHLLENHKFTLTNSLGPNFPRCEFNITEPGDITDYLKCGPITLGSSELVNLYRHLGVQAEFHFVTLYLMDGSVLDTYYLIQYLEEADAIDTSKSIYTMDQGYIDEIEKLVFRDTIESIGPIFLAANSTDRLRICTSKAMTAIQESKLTGFYFQKPGEWRW